MSASEELREALLTLEEARKREAQQRKMAEALLAGLRVLVLTTNTSELFPGLFEVMREPLDFESAFVLIAQADETFVPVASSDPLLLDTRWFGQAMFARVIAGHPVAVFDTQQVEEWRNQPVEIKQTIRSALLFALHTAEKKALFVCTHSQRAHFAREHIGLARRFSVLASQALQQLESEAKLADLEEQLESEAKLAALHKKLADSEKKLARARKMEALGLLAGGVAHDLNNILSGIVSYPQLLLLEPNLSDEYRDVIETIQEAGRRAVAVVADLLTVARGVASAREVINLNHILQQYLRSPEHQQYLRSYPDISITTDLDPQLLNTRVSSIHAQKALMNLITNAIDAIRQQAEGQLHIATQNRYLDRPLKGYEDVQMGEYAVLTVTDNGSGISTEDLERIFEPFYAKKSMGRSGTGLGLTIVWNTMQDHEGYVDVSTSNQGTTFALYFPICREAVPVLPQDVSLDACRGQGQLILVVDDQEDQRKIACALLRTLGYETAAVASGEEALSFLQERQAALIILDMIMDPGINGRETYQRIIQQHPGQKAIIASGYSLTDDVRAAQQLGAGAYVKKPYTMEILGLAIKETLSR